MPKTNYTSNLFADDKDILDLLQSTQRNISTKKLRSFLIQRGIYTSESEPRDHLINQIVSLTLSWHDICHFLKESQGTERQEKSTYRTLKTKCDKETLCTNLASIIQNEENNLGEYNPKLNSDNKSGAISIEITYTEIDHSRNRLHQKKHQTSTITISSTENGYNFRFDANEKTKAAVRIITERLLETSQVVFEVEAIDLEELSHHNKNRFFLDLIRNIENAPVRDVSKVTINRIPMGEHDDEFDDDDDTLSEHEDTLSDQNERNLVGYVRNMVLQGGSITESSEYTQLARLGIYYICGIVWTTLIDNVLVCFEVGFEDKENCKDFRHHVRGVYPPKNNAPDEHTNQMRRCDELDRVKYLKIIEQSASRVLKEIKTNPGENQ